MICLHLGGVFDPEFIGVLVLLKHFEDFAQQVEFSCLRCLLFDVLQ
jgi:hypothetical protein